ncbi:hypothetical protein LguiB_031464 [Lonicera macranthoides]
MSVLHIKFIPLISILFIKSIHTTAFLPFFFKSSAAHPFLPFDPSILPQTTAVLLLLPPSLHVLQSPDSSSAIRPVVPVFLYSVRSNQVFWWWKQKKSKRKKSSRKKKKHKKRRNQFLSLVSFIDFFLKKNLL